MTEFGLPEKTLKVLRDFFAQTPSIQTVKIYGSRAMGTFWRGSDIDLAVFGESKLNISAIQGAIDELPTPYKFDILDYKTLSNVALKEHIDRVGKVLYTQ